MRDQLKAQHISEQEKRTMTAAYYVQTSYQASWEHLVDHFYQYEEQKAVEAVRDYWQAPRGTGVMVTE